MTMVFPQAPYMDYTQLYEDQQRAYEQTPMAEDRLPAYAEAMKGRKSVDVSEKEFYRSDKKKGSSRMSTLKSILSGDVHKHNPRYVLEESVSGEPSPIRQKEPSQVSAQQQWNHDRVLAMQSRRPKPKQQQPAQSRPAPSSAQLDWNRDRLLAMQSYRPKSRPAPAEPVPEPYMSPQMQFNSDRLAAMQVSRPKPKSSRPEERQMNAQMEWNRDRLLAYQSGPNKRG